jgi:hypothetical protein
MKWYIFIIYFILGLPILYKSIMDIFLLGITCDGIFSGFYFLYKYFQKDLTENQILNSVGDIYIIDTVTRYQYYIFLDIFYYLTNLLIFFKTDYLYYIFYPFILPPFINCLYGNTEIGKIFFNSIINKRNIFLKKFFSKQLSKLIENYPFITGTPPICITYKKIMPVWDHLDNITDIIISILKNILIITGINYLKSNYSNVSYNFFKKIYNYKSGEVVSTNLTLEQAQTNIRSMILKNEWNKITSAQIINSFKIIYSNFDTQNISMKKKLEFKIIIFFSYWSIGNFIKLEFIPVINAIIEIYRSIKTMKIMPNYYKITNTILAILITFIFKNAILTSFITSFGCPLFINNITFSLISYISSKKYILIDIHFNKSKFFYMLFYTMWIIFNIFINKINILNNIFINKSLINNIGSIIISTLIKKSTHKYIFLILYITNIINDNNLLNLIINFYIIFITSNIWEFCSSQIKISKNINTNIDINLKKILNNIDEINDNNLKKENLIKNTEKINYFVDDDNKKFNYYLENSMIII